VSDNRDKTVVVRVERRFTHPVMKKTVRSSKNITPTTKRTSLRSVTLSGSKSVDRCRSQRWEVTQGEKKRSGV